MSHIKGKLSVKRIGSKLFIVDDKGFTVTKVRYSKKAEAYATELVRRWNSQPDLLDACKAWMKVESEMLSSTPCPDLALRAQYRKQAVELTEAAITNTKKE